MQPDASTATQILKTAESLVKSRGYNAFSYADIAKVVGISTASIHYHFPCKSDLVRDLVAGYTESIEGRLNHVLQNVAGVHKRLEAYVAGFRESLGNADRICPCTMLAAEAGTLPADVRSKVEAFIRLNEEWVARVIAEGRKAGEITFTGTAMNEARAICSTIQGAGLVARGCGDMSRFDAVTSRLLRSLK